VIKLKIKDIFEKIEDDLLVFLSYGNYNPNIAKDEKVNYEKEKINV
jgi:hypothetical protein